MFVDQIRTLTHIYGAKLFFETKVKKSCRGHDNLFKDSHSIARIDVLLASRYQFIIETAEKRKSHENSKNKNS